MQVVTISQFAQHGNKSFAHPGFNAALLKNWSIQ